MTSIVSVDGSQKWKYGALSMTMETSAARRKAEFSLSQHLLDGRLRASAHVGLDEWLLAQREASRTYEEIARDIWLLTDEVVSVSYQTVKRWCVQAQQREVA